MAQNILKRFCYRNELTPQSIAKVSGVSRSLIYRLINGTNTDLLNLKYITVKKLEKAGFYIETELLDFKKM